MKSETANKILSEILKETIDKVRETANKLVMKNKKEPLMGSEEFHKSEKEQGYVFLDMFDFARQYSDYAVEWYLNNAKEFVADDAEICTERIDRNYTLVVDKQSIHTAIDNYIKDKL